MLAGGLCLLLVTGCLQRPSAPESRAAYFVEKLVLEPQALEDLHAVAVFPADGPADVLATEVPVRTALAYLRARVRLGARLGFHTGDVAKPSPERRQVTVSVSEGLTFGTRDAVHFQVDLTRQDGDWMITQLHAD